MHRSPLKHFNSFLSDAFRRWAALGRFTKIFACAILVLAAAILPVNVLVLQEKDHTAPVDFGDGPDKPPIPKPRHKLGDVLKHLARASAPLKASNAPAAVPAAPSRGGFFGPAFAWPIIPLHMALLPDGRVLNFGTDQTGAQGAQMIYDVWDPKIGNVPGAHTILSNTTGTDIFCAGVSLLDGSGNVLITGGDLTISGERNFAQNKVNIFNPAQNTLTPSQSMNYARWYASITTLPNGEKLLLGGDNNKNDPITGGERTPEVRNPTLGWRKLPGISIDPNQWYYPRGFVGADGAVYVVQEDGTILRLTTDGVMGTMQDTGLQVGTGAFYYPSVMFTNANGNPFSVLTVRAGLVVKAVDISNSPPVLTSVSSPTYDRRWGNATLLADGTILYSGGSGVVNQLTNVAYQAELYNPATGTWTLDATAAIPRLYHSATLLLPDGSVLTGGGGAPGPINELNAEIYFPPYLYLPDGSGNPAPRPQIFSAPSTALQLGQNFLMTVGANDQIGKVNLIRVGANTHAFNSEERLISLPFTQSGTQITATLNASPNLAPPGYYMLFVLNSSGVPAIAKIVSVAPTYPDLVPTSISYDSTSGSFTSVVANQGQVSTTTGIPIGVAYLVDGTKCTWGAVDGPLGTGASVTIGTQGGPCSISTGTHTITIVADDANRMQESNKNNNTLAQTITVTGGGPQLPDLIPTSISYDSTSGLFTSVVLNQGNAATPTGVTVGVAYLVDGVQCTWGFTNTPLAPGASATIGTQGGACVIPVGTHTITVFADDVNRMQESNKNNNTLAQTITVTGGPQLPDLIATSISYDRTSGLFTSVVLNQGNAATPTGVVIGVAYLVDGVKQTWGVVNGPLAAGASVTIGTQGGAYTITAGTHTIAVVADDANRIVESNKNNNTLTQTITGLPDLIPTSISYDKTSGLFTSVVLNQGNAGTPTGVVIGVAYLVDGVKQTWGVVNGPLAVGASVTIGTQGGAYTIPNGTHTITVFADDENRIPESNETNNKLSQTIQVP